MQDHSDVEVCRQAISYRPSHNKQAFIMSVLQLQVLDCSLRTMTIIRLLPDRQELVGRLLFAMFENIPTWSALFYTNAGTNMTKSHTHTHIHFTVRKYVFTSKSAVDSENAPPHPQSYTHIHPPHTHTHTYPCALGLRLLFNQFPFLWNVQWPTGVPVYYWSKYS